MAVNHALVVAVREGLARAGSPADAAPMQRYMKSQMPFHGVKAGPRRKLLKTIFDGHPLASWRDLLATSRALWTRATHREERYATTDLLRLRRYREHVSTRAMPLYEELIVTGAWWDHVDEVASHLVRGALDEEPGPVATTLRGWMASDDRWKRRTTIICQLRRKADTDVPLLVEAIEAARNDGDFFLRKAIGWALRDYARIDPDWVEDYVAKTEAHLSPLSRREALKNLR